MFKSLTAVVLSLALALPASAQNRGMSDSDRAIGALIGIAGAAIIINEISKSKKKDDRRRDHEVRPAPPRDHGRDHGRGHGRDYGNGKGWITPDRDHQVRVLPGACEISVRDRRGDVTRMLGKRCLERSVRDADRQFANCRVDVRTRDGIRSGYTVRCLERAGYRISRR